MTTSAPDPAGLTGPSPFRVHWGLDPEITFLNHGSYGAAPRVVLAHQDELRRRLESEPVRFMQRELEGLLDEARAALAALVGADAEDVAFVPNATTGVNTVLESLVLQPGDELLSTDHVYNACANAMQRVAARFGAKLTIAKVPFPLISPTQVTESVLGAANERTRLCLLDHVTSPTGLVFPVETLVQELESRGVPVLVDGAHALGMLPLDLGRLGASYYTANAHKWLCTPKGSAFLHVRRDRQAALRPLVVSHGANSPRTDRSRFRLEFDWTGTQDPSAWLTIPTAIRFLKSLMPGGIPALLERNRRLALAGRDLLCAALDVRAPAPDTMLGSLASVPLPAPFSGPVSNGALDPIHDRLFREHRIEVPVMPWPRPGQRVLRIAAAAHNDLEQVRRLVVALEELREQPFQATGRP